MSEASPSEAETAGPAAGAPTRAGISRQLWQDAQQDIQNCLHHPFVRALGAGTLPKCDHRSWFHMRAGGVMLLASAGPNAASMQ